MASYFDIKPAPSKPAAAASLGTELEDLHDKDAIGKLGLLSPQVSRILDDMRFEDQSDSDEECASQSDGDGAEAPSKSSNPHIFTDKPDKASQTPQAQNKQHLRIVQEATTPGLEAGPSRPRHKGGRKNPHLSRLQSLRTMLFSSHVEEALVQERAGQKWKEEHENRRALNRPNTPEKEPKEKLTTRLNTRLRRLTSKDVQTMIKIKEDRPASTHAPAAVAAENASTASSDEDEDKPIPQPRYNKEKGNEEVDDWSDDVSINHSGLEDLKRWISRQDPPSDGETRGRKAQRDNAASSTSLKDDSDHESFGHSDVDDLVRWMSRKDRKLAAEHGDTKQAGASPDRLSEASTVSDSEGEGDVHEDDVDELVRWVSRRDGPNAGPVREKKHANGTGRARSGSDLENADVDDLVRWVSRKDPASGTSKAADTTPSEAVKPVADTKRDRLSNTPKASSNLKTEALLSPM